MYHNNNKFIRSSPGGQVLQDYHWSGGMYSHAFESTDKFQPQINRSDLYNIYGHDFNDKSLGFEKTYNNQQQNFPIEMKPTIKKYAAPIGKNYEKFVIESSQKNIAGYISMVIVLTFVFLYLFDKTFGGYVNSLDSWIKVLLMIFILVVLLLTVINKSIQITLT